jgi:hypothetical protein
MKQLVKKNIKRKKRIVKREEKMKAAKALSKKAKA